MAAGIPTLDPDRESLHTLREFWFYTLARLISEAPLTDAYVPTYQSFGLKIEADITKETQLRNAIAIADANAIAADRVLNTLLDQLAALIHGGKQPDVTLPKHQLYFGNDTPAEAARPTLGPQLDLMDGWPALLVKETAQAYLDLIAPVTAAVAAGKTARQAVKNARAANASYRLTERRQLFDEYNALAATTFGELGAFAHDHADLNLPGSWARSCFRHVTRDPGPQSVAEVDEMMAKHQAQLDALAVLRAELVKKAEEEAAADEEAAKAEAELAAAKKAEEAAKKAKKDAEKKAKAAKKKAKK